MRSPFFVRGFIKRGIAKSTPEALHDRFLLFFEGEAELQRLAGFLKDREDDAYILGLTYVEGVGHRVNFLTRSSCEDSVLGEIVRDVKRKAGGEQIRHPLERGPKRRGPLKSIHADAARGHEIRPGNPHRES